jgi:dCMP deaminase
MRRPSREETALSLAAIWAKRGTCCRRQVGCVLVDADGHELSTGYNGPASGMPHCTRETPCPGASSPSGQGLDLCEAVHAEANALLFCPDVRKIEYAYVTCSPCVHCVKLLMNTGCRVIIFSERYAHDQAAEALWTRSTAPSGRPRQWLKGSADGS